MKQFLFSLVALLVVSASNMSSNAQVFNSFASTISVEDLAGNYNGDLTKVYMNGDKDPVEGQISTVSLNSNGSIKIHMDAFQIGSMPGTITIDANNISLDTDGNFNTTCSRCVVLRFLGIPTRYNAHVVGQIKNGELTYTLTVNSEYSGAPFTAEVTFKGEK